MAEYKKHRPGMTVQSKTTVTPLKLKHKKLKRAKYKKLDPMDAGKYRATYGGSRFA